MDTFISYSKNDRKMAHATKLALHGFGITGFLAHEDLKVSEEWQEAIIEKLGTVQVFIALLSKHFKASEWCAQEIGYIFSRSEVLVVPLSLDDTVSFGFISKLQSERVHVEDDISVILRDVLFRKKPRLAIPLWIKKIEAAGSYRGAEAVVAPMVPHFASFTPKEVESFLIAALGNAQVWDASLCRADYLPVFARQHWGIISKKLKREFMETLKLSLKEIKTGSK